MSETLALDFATSPDPKGDVAIRAQIQRTVERILGAFGSGALRSIILTGAMTVGEGTVRVSEGGRATVLSDLDLYLVAAPGADLESLRRQASAVARALRAEVSEQDVASSFDLAAVSVDEVASASVTIGTVDLRNRGRVIWGQDVLSGLPGLDPIRIPARDAVTLILNRIVEQLFYRPEGPEAGSQMAVYHVAKTGADQALAILALLGEYLPTYRQRAERIREVWGEPRLVWLKERVPDLPERVGVWTEYKLRPDPERLAIAMVGRSGAVGATELWSRLVPVVEAVWVWALRTWTGIAEEDPERLAPWIGRMETLRERLRGWRTAWRSGDIRIGPGGLWRLARRAPRGSPLSHLYAAASLVYFASPGRNGTEARPVASERYLRRARQLTPVPLPKLGESEWEGMRSALVDCWRRTVMRGMR